MKVFWQPNPGPQTDVLLCQADEILYGGARGGGAGSDEATMP